MSKSFLVVSGDLVTAGRSFETVRGTAKLLQDLKHRIIERIGTDPATPEFGSRFESDTYIGESYTKELEMEARAEIISLIQDYQQEQLAKIKAEIVRYSGDHTLDPNEVIDTINSIESVSIGTTILLRISLTTLSGQSVRVDVPLET